MSRQFCRSILIAGITCYLLLSASESMAQVCATTSKGNDLIPNQSCAPVDAYWEATYRGVYSAATTVEMIFIWGDGDADTITATQVIDPGGTPAVLASDRVFEATSSHIYPRGGDQCTYNAQVYLYVDGTLCTSSIQEQIVTVWDRDDSNGGEIAIAPTVYRVCVGNSATVNFDDVSDFNCTPPEENDVINEANRWVRWDYGTTNTITGTVLIDGSPEAFVFEGDVEYLAQPVVGPNSTSLDITVPATALVGEVFQVRLNNWNQCNPYDADTSDDPFSPVSGDLSNGDSAAVFEFAIIEIVDTAQASYITRLDNAGGNVQDTFCIGDQIYFDNETPGVAGAAFTYAWEFYEDLTGTSLGGTSTANNPTYTYFTPGDKLVRLRVTDNNAFGACESVFTDTVHMSPNSIAAIELQDTTGATISGIFCEDSISRTVVFRDVSPGKVAGITQYQWEFYDESNTLVETLPSAGTFSNTEIDSVVRTYSNPGIYRAVLTTRDRITSCITVDEDSVIIYAMPEAAWEADTACEGAGTNITNTSSLSTSINGDAIGFWEWDFDYDGSSFSPDLTQTTDPGTFNYDFGTAGSYVVALQVTTDQGTCSDLYVDTVLVNPVPLADFFPGDTADCPDFEITFENLTVASQPAGLTIDRYEWYIDSDDGSGFVLDATQTATDTTFTRTFQNNKGGSTDHLYQVFLRAVAQNGCFTDSDTSTVTVFSAPASAYTSSYDVTDPNCSPVSINFQADLDTELLNPDSYVWTVTLNDSTIDQLVQGDPSAADFGDYSYTFENTSASLQQYIITMQPEKAGTCILPYEEPVTIYPVPDASFAVTDTTDACDLVTYRLQAAQPGLVNYEWIFSTAPAGTPTDNGDNITVSFNRPGNGTGDLEVYASLVSTNGFNCVSDTITDTLLVTEQEVTVIPELSLLSDTLLCPPARIRLQNITAAYPAGTVFRLEQQIDAASPVDVVADSGDVATTIALDLIQPGSYEFTLYATSPNGCNYNSSPPVTLTIAEDSEANFSIDNATGCSPLTTAINASPVNADSETWLIEDLSNGDTIYGPAAGSLLFYDFENLSDTTKTFRISYFTDNAAGCSDDSSLTVTVYPQAEASYSIIDPIPTCQPYTVRFVNTSQNPAGTDYLWSWGDGLTLASNDDTVSHTFANSTYTVNLSYSVRLTATTADGCTEDTVATIESYPQVEAAISADRLSGCAPFTVNFDNNSLGASAPASAWYMQEAGDSSTRSFISSDFAISQPFTNTSDSTRYYEIIYEAVNTGGCTDYDTLSITVYPQVVADFVTDLPTQGCQPLALNFLPQGYREGLRYVWNWGDGSDADTSFDESQIAHTFINNSTSVTRNFLVTLTATDTLTGCEMSSSQSVRVFPEVRIDVEAVPASGCAPLEVSADNASQGVDSHRWYYRLQGSSEQLEAQTQAVPFWLLENTTTDSLVYEIVYEAANANGCDASDTLLVTVYPQVIADFDADPLRQTLPDTTVNLTNLSNNLSAWDYLWTFGDGDSSRLAEPGSHSYPGYGTYEITLFASNRWCSDEASRTVVIEPIDPIVDFAPDTTAGCPGLVVNFTNLSEFADASSFIWDFGDGIGTSTLVNPTYVYNEPGSYTVSLQASNATGTEIIELKEALIEVYEQPIARFGIRPEIAYLPLARIFTDNRSTNADSYWWDFGDGFFSTDFEPSHQYSQQGQYDLMLVATTAEGCVDTLIREGFVQVQDGGQLRIPNAFTPSEDGPSTSVGGLAGGINDVFLPITTGVTEYHMQIYNRWGELLFESFDKEIGWDGYYRGELSPPDVYVYRLNLTFSNGEQTVRAGDVTLVR